ncbi:uncharacterized protein AMSG_08083 [Thecamonas trahens ATCC 50062]|uniref:Uncharacterized protein n=1 Tax=Thecamonas trahens ATCC 50062 TaxID=461836 RepID=A0A0L0DJP7_THETB|nr:hypothetical protein AMSG_08083 [Thecamonas trahens ATCC 50062]KNC52517.1 hypothetical protein AMSG_08083 [Thecamonas trahens ATCC 50062]|eukprot:XP_013755310.1 hypothetical protein AMSG_08083 [Thecamonas trahens ATCC 50062]
MLYWLGLSVTAAAVVVLVILSTVPGPASLAAAAGPTYSIPLAQAAANLVLVHTALAGFVYRDTHALQRRLPLSHQLTMAAFETVLVVMAVAAALAPVVPPLGPLLMPHCSAFPLPPIAVDSVTLTGLAVVGLGSLLLRKAAAATMNWSLAAAATAAAAGRERPWRMPYATPFSIIRHPVRLAHAGVGAVALVALNQGVCPVMLYTALALLLGSQLVVGVAADEAASGSRIESFHG